MCQQTVQAFRVPASTKTTGVFAFEFTHLILSSSYHSSLRKGFARPFTLPQLHPEAPLHAATDGRVRGGAAYIERKTVSPYSVYGFWHDGSMSHIPTTWPTLHATPSHSYSHLALPHLLPRPKLKGISRVQSYG